MSVFLIAIVFLIFRICLIIKEMKKKFTAKNLICLCLFTALIEIIFYIIIYSYYDEISDWWVAHVGYLIYILFLSLSWLLIINDDNLQEIKFTNLKFSFVVGIILQLNSYYWKVLKIDFIIPFNYLRRFKTISIEQDELLSVMVNVVFSPIFIMLASGALIAAYREHVNNYK